MNGPDAERWERYKAEVTARLDYHQLYSVIEGQKPSGEGCVVGLCPFHDDHNPSFGIDYKKGTWECFAGCGKGDAFAFLQRRTGKPFKEILIELGDRYGIPRPEPEPPPMVPTSHPVTYDYRDVQGQLLYQVVRQPGKRFFQRRPDGHGGWINSLRGVPRVPYHLPELVARSDETVYIVEGEKDADRLHRAGLLATTNSGGSGKWTPSHSDFLRGRKVVILPDNDEPGRKHAASVAESLRGVAASVKILDLPDLPEKGDVSDWLDAGHTTGELQELADAAEELPPIAGMLPRIQVNQRQLSDVIDDAWRALLAGNDPPGLFISHGRLSRVVYDDQTPRIEFVDEATAYGLLVRAASWFKVRGADEDDAKPPAEVARDILAFPRSDLPRLDEVVTAPVFDAEGRLLVTTGYHPDARLWLDLDDQMTRLRVPERPTSADLEKALKMIREHLLVDFPFASESDEAHALAALLLPFVRRMIQGPTPIHLIEAPTPGSGKSLLADLIAIVATGRSSEATTVTRNEDEARKKLTAILSRGRPVVVIDNVQGGLESAQLASAITAEVWSDRILGKTQMVEFPNRALWLVTGNNPKLTMEIARRCVRIRLEPSQERPWERTGFTHDPIRSWARQHRQGLVWSILVIVQAWISARHPRAVKTLGSFEDWAAVIGGILQHAGVRDFLEDTEEFYEAADAETSEWRAFVTAWYERLGTQPVTPSQLMTLAEELHLVPFALGGGSDAARLARFGRHLSALRDRKIGDVRVVVTRNKKRGSNDYRLVPVVRELFPAQEEA